MRFDGFSHMLSHWARQTPDTPALRYGERTCSYRELFALVNARADELRAGGKTCLGILADGSLDCVLEIFAGNLAGLQLVLLDANLPEEMLMPLLRYTDADALWTADDELAELLAPALTDGVTDGAGLITFTLFFIH